MCTVLAARLAACLDSRERTLRSFAPQRQLSDYWLCLYFRVVLETVYCLPAWREAELVFANAAKYKF